QRYDVRDRITQDLIAQCAGLMTLIDNRLQPELIHGVGELDVVVIQGDLQAGSGVGLVYEARRESVRFLGPQGGVAAVDARRLKLLTVEQRVLDAAASALEVEALGESRLSHVAGKRRPE